VACLELGKKYLLRSEIAEDAIVNYLLSPTSSTVIRVEPEKNDWRTVWIVALNAGFVRLETYFTKPGGETFYARPIDVTVVARWRVGGSSRLALTEGLTAVDVVD